MSKVLSFAYGLVCYAIFLATFLYAIGFVAGVGVPRSIDSGHAAGGLSSLLIDLGLLSLFAVQHSVMARPWFKERWTRLMPHAIERSTYVFASSLALALLFWQWRPLPQLVWAADAPALRALLQGLGALGWLSKGEGSTSVLSGSRRPSRPSRPAASTATSATR